MEDQAILDLYWARNQDAISETAKKYGPYCHRISFQILRNAQDADECVNDTWLRTWHAIPPQRPEKFQAFLGKITRNLSLDRWERAAAEKRGGGRTTLLLSELEDCIPVSGTVEQTLEDRVISTAIAAWLRQQPQRSRVAFLRRYWYADSLSQVAKRLRISENAVKALLFRLRGSLRQHLEKEGIQL